MAKDGGAPVILVREETSPEDIRGMAASVGILTASFRRSSSMPRGTRSEYCILPKAS